MNNKYYRNKDAIKFSVCNKLISQGCIGSSSYFYNLNGIGKLKTNDVNCESYCEDDIVGVSVNGNRRNRKGLNKILIMTAIKSKVTFVSDSICDANREYNIGERELILFLEKNGYERTEETNELRSVWKINEKREGL